MDIGVISVRYARALLKAATDAKAEDKVYQEMLTLAKSYIDVPDLRRTIDNPMLAKDKKEALLVVACGGRSAASGASSASGGTTATGLSEQTTRFIGLVLREGREGILQFMANSYTTLYRRQKNIIRGKLTTAVNVSKAVEQKMRQMVEGRTKGTVQFETEVDPDIIGGFVLEYDTYRLDASVQSRLRGIQAQLKR